MTMEEELEAEELSREREPPTPDVEEEEEAVATPLVPSTSGKQETGGFVFGGDLIFHANLNFVLMLHVVISRYKTRRSHFDRRS